MCSALKSVLVIVNARGISDSLQGVEDRSIYKVEVMESFEI